MKGKRTDYIVGLPAVCHRAFISVNSNSPPIAERIVLHDAGKFKLSVSASAFSAEDDNGKSMCHTSQWK